VMGRQIVSPVRARPWERCNDEQQHTPARRRPRDLGKSRDLDRVRLSLRRSKLSEAELTRITRSIELADVTDETTWTPADKALRP
jgi:hypothetical protein